MPEPTAANPLEGRKTLVVNLVIAVAAFFPAVQDVVMKNPEATLWAIAGFNTVLRLLTKGKVQLF